MSELFKYRPLVAAYARRYQGRGLEREDLEQEGWLALVAAEQDYRSERNVPRAAFYRRRVWSALKAVLRRQRRDVMGGDWLPLTESAEAATAEYDLNLDTLSCRQRQVLELYYCQGLGLAGIARQLGLSLGTVHTYKQRGLRALARMS